MAEATGIDLEELLDGEITREQFATVRDEVLSAFSKFRYAEHWVGQSRAALRSARGAEKKRLAGSLAVVATALGRFHDALGAVEALDGDADARFLAGRCLLGLGRVEEALEHLEACPAADQEAQALLAEAQAAAGRGQEARKTLHKQKLDKADSAQSCYLLGRIAEAEGVYDEALELYGKAIELDDRFVPALFRLAFNLDINGKDEQAIELYERCVAQTPTELSALLNLGVLYEDQELYYEAVECYRRILAVDPNNGRARLYLRDAEGSLDMWVDEEKIKKLKFEDEVLRIPVSDFELSVRSRNCLDRMGIRNLGDLTRVTEQELLSFKNFGETSLNEIRQMLSIKGLRLGQNLEEDPEAAQASKQARKEMEEKLATPVGTLNLSTRCRRCMERLNVQTLGDLIKYTEQELLAMPNFGRTSVNELKEKLAEVDLELPKKKEA
jgi:DNA-directed RNA polymerase subunit alpha